MFYIFALFLVWIGFRFISKTLTRYIEFIKHEKRWLPRNKRITISTIMVVLALIIIVIGSNQIYIEWKTNKMEKKMRSYNETCKSNGGDYASPLIDEKFVGFNCCKNINDSSINCTKNTVV